MTIDTLRGRLMVNVDEFASQLSDGRPLFVAGDEDLLRRLPKGDWVGGTSAYFIGEAGGLHSRDRLSSVVVPEFATGFTIKVYDAASIADVYTDAPDNGYSLIVIPSASNTLRAFALNGPRYANFASRPLAGWVSGVDLADVGKVAPRVFDGRTGAAYDDAAVVLHVSLPRSKTAEVGLINIFEPGDGDVLTFAVDGFAAKEVFVDGKPVSFVRYIKERRLDIRLPLVADYNGAMVNTSFQRVDEAFQEVRFYGPVFRGVRYRHARPIGDYISAFSSQLPKELAGGVDYSCNCILNYLYAELEGRRTPGFTGTMTFGEIAYQLLNQTLVYLKIEDANLCERLRGETALRKQFHALEAVTQGLESFNSMVSHDLRAPLRHMREFSRLLQDSPAASADACARDYASRIVSAADRMTSLLDGLASFAHAGRAELCREPVDLGELVGEVRAELHADCRERNIVWDVRPLPVIQGDRALLRQVFVNLLSNAIKYTSGRTEARVRIRARRGDKGTVVAVHDNGIGFDPQASGRLFEPFHRLESASRFPGSGIGLAIVARIAARHGGRAWAEAKPGRWASFFVSIPDR
jgi:signal transduction histidine kinase